MLRPPLERTASARASSATRRSEATRAIPSVGVAVLGLLTLLEGVEAVGEGHHAVTAQGVIERVLDILTGDVAEDVLALAQDVIDRDGQCGLLLTQELVGDRAVPNPLVTVVASAVTAGGAVTQVGADDQSEGCRVGAVEHAAPCVDVAVVGRGNRVGRGLETVTGTQLNVKHAVAEGQTR